MNGGFQSPLFLWLLPLAILPFFTDILRAHAYPSTEGLPRDDLSRLLEWALPAIAALAIGSVIVALAGPYSGGGAVKRIGQGAETILLIDRSGSMNETFAGHTPRGDEISKAGAARHVLEDYVRHRLHDRFGVVAFSTAPIAVLPMTDHTDAVLAAVASIDRPGLDYTDIGRGLAMALSALERESVQPSRAILLVSDGAAVISHEVQDKLMAGFTRTPVHLYWLFLRAANANGITTPPAPGEDTSQSMPERHLDRFFKKLGIPYRAFEVENPDAVEEAVAEISRLETRPITYEERVASYDLTPIAVGVSLGAICLLLLAKAIETGMSPSINPVLAHPAALGGKGKGTIKRDGKESDHARS
ncbi:vWA domain-containing protein [Beijerinckia mobilis]|uniref:vWA domain-containing protein n=1 Tax=Beijerinckia mobilis TaxID=231434 RepID=UPI00068BB312|nr:vWA domain-containing protein [Beijerinckia mobilis]